MLLKLHCLLQCLEKCPEKFARDLYLLYAKMEEDYGLARHAMQVYSRATKAVPREEKLSIYNIYLQHAQQIYGVTKTREIYQVGQTILMLDYSKEP